MSNALERLDSGQQRIVRERVRGLLDKTSAFSQLSPEERQNTANALVNIVAFLADPDPAGRGEAPGGAGGVRPLAQAQAQAARGGRDDGRRRGGGQKIVQEDFSAAAGREGAELFEQLTGAVDFPEFVSSLIDGVFNSIVDASIRQMEAYSKLLESVVKSVNEFAKDNFTPNQGRDWLANRFPNQMRVNVQGGQPRLQATATGEEQGLDEVQRALGMEQGIDLDDEDAERALAERGQLEMARLRQKQLATMVLLGINRIVVTDGLINAKVLIDVKTSDVASRTNRASSYDSKDEKRKRRSGGGWFSDDSDVRDERHRTIVSSATEDTSESRADAKARLSGEVKVAFRSETFPLEKLASQTQLESVNQLAQQGGAGG